MKKVFEQKQIHALVVGIAVAVGIFAAIKLFSEDSQTHSLDTKTASRSLGRVVPLGQDVRHKSSSSQWSRVQAKQSVFDQDRIYAGETSRARVELENGGLLHVAPNTLVTVSRSKADQMAEIESGSMIGELIKGGRLLIKQGEKITTLSGEGKFILQKKVDGLKLEVLSGILKIVTSRKEKVLQANEPVELAEKTEGPQDLPKDPIALETPARGQEIWLEDKQALPFKWSGTNQPVRLFIAYTPDFKNAFTKEISTQSHSVVVSPNAQYYWKVESLDGHQVSALGVFTTWVKPLASPPTEKEALPVPTLAQEYRFEIYQQSTHDEKNIAANYEYTDTPTIATEVQNNAKSYEWALDRNEKGHTETHALKSDAAEIKPEQLRKPGLYKLKVRYQSTDQRWSPWSQPASLHVVLAPPKKIQITQKKSEVTFTWHDMDHVPQYEVALQLPGSPERASQGATSSTTQSIESLAPGDYFVSVRTLNEQSWPTSPWSKPQAFKVRAAPKVLAKTEKPVEKQRPPKYQVKVKTPLKQKRAAASIVPITPETANVGTLEPVKQKGQRRLELFAGMGTNYLEFHQRDAGNEETGKFASVTSPTSMIEAKLQWNEDWKYALSFNRMPGRISVAPGNTINKSTYDWTYLGLEAQRRFYTSRTGVQVAWTLGAQRHEMPFLVSGSTYDINLVQTQLTTASIGLNAIWSPKTKWNFESLLRYQLPLASQSDDGGNFKVNGSTSFDGLLGLSRDFNENWKMGLYWFGQSHDLSYRYISGDGSTIKDGKQQLFNSDLQVRFSYLWFFLPFALCLPQRRRG